MRTDVFNALVQLEAQQRARVGGSLPLPFIWIDWVNFEGLLDFTPVTPREANEATGHITRMQWAWAERKELVMIAVVAAADDSQLDSGKEITLADLQPLFQHPSPRMLLRI